MQNSEKKVLVIDSDESNFGLHRQLGFELPKDFTLYFGGKKKTMELLNTEGATLFHKKWKFDDIPSEYTTGDGQIQLVAIGKIHEAGEGCACPMGKLAARFLENIEEGNDIVIEDTEAGVEHFGRGVDARADVILMVVDTSFESIKLAEKVTEMGHSIGKPVFVVLNKINGTKAELIRNNLSEKCVIVGEILESTAILEEGLKGFALVVELPEIDAVIKRIEEMSELNHISFVNKYIHVLMN